MQTTTITVRVGVDIVSRLEALATRLSSSHGSACAPGERVTRTAAARLALRQGIAALEAADLGQQPARTHHAAVHMPDAAELDAAMEALERLADLDFGSVHLEVLHALSDLDVDVLRALRRLDPHTVEALAMLDVSHVDALNELATGPLPDVSDRPEDLC